MSTRIDIWLVQQGFFESRTKAARAVQEGLVFINKQKAIKSQIVEVNDVVSVLAYETYVSQGALKLQALLDRYALNPEGLNILDIGASTGGFTDLVLKRGAAAVVCVDVGKGQLHHSLLHHPRVHNYEQTDIREFSKEQSPYEVFDWIIGDVSFISLSSILPFILKWSQVHTLFLLLLKPQFEIGPQRKHKKGILKDEQQIENALQDFIRVAQTEGLDCLGYVSTKGLFKEKKNEEFMVYLKRKEKS